MVIAVDQQSLALAPSPVKSNSLTSTASIPALLNKCSRNHSGYNGYNELFAVS